MTGRLYGLGLGPGDPELLTLKAVRILRSVSAIAYPVPEGGASFARRIAAPHLPGGQAEIPIPMPMRVDPAPGAAAYDRAAEAIGARLDAGTDVAVLCEGDPFFYGSFMPLFARLADRHAVEVVPGISSVMAAAAAAFRPLAARNEAITVIPGPLPDAAIAQRLAACDSFAILKVGRHMPRLRALLTRLGLADACTYAERVSLPDARIAPLAEAPDAAPYFSLILGRTAGSVVRRGGAAAPDPAWARHGSRPSQRTDHGPGPSFLFIHHPGGAEPRLDDEPIEMGSKGLCPLAGGAGGSAPCGTAIADVAP